MSEKDINLEPCPYCGQISITGECDCAGAQRERKIKQQILTAKNLIYEIFVKSDGDDEDKTPIAEENVQILNLAVELIANFKMHDAKFMFAGGVKAKLSRTAKGVIKIERSKVLKDVAEVDE